MRTTRHRTPFSLSLLAALGSVATRAPRASAQTAPNAPLDADLAPPPTPSAAPAPNSAPSAPERAGGADVAPPAVASRATPAPLAASEPVERVYVLPPQETPEARAPGDGTDALPALVTLPVAGFMRRGVSVTGAGGYGYTESVLDGTDAHHRVAGSLALAVRPLAWLAVGARFDGRYDSHSSAMNPGDDGFVGDPRVFVRAAGSLANNAIGLGLQASVWLPGGDAPSVATDAITPEFDALFSWRNARGVPVTVAALAGFRYDQSARSAPQPEGLTPADRLALGVGLGPTVKLGLGASFRVLPRVELLAEWRWDVLLGASAPAPLESPMHVRAGVRVHPLAYRSLYVGFALDVSPSARPDFGRPMMGMPMGPPPPLSPVDPRVGALVSLGVQLPFNYAPPPRILRSIAPERLPDPVPVVEPEPPEPVVTTGTVAGRITTPAGEALADARVEVHVGSEVREATTDASGLYRVENVPAGEAEILVRARRFREQRQRVTVRAGGEASTGDARFTEVLPLGQIRGLLRGFDGQPVRGTVRVEPVGVERVANPDGTFEIDVAPGAYQVRVTAAGFAPQNRRVRVEDNGVTVLNAELRGGGGRPRRGGSR